MSLPTLTLAGFLLARIAEDERVAQDAGARIFPSTWQETENRIASGWHLAHIARHDPARVLAECDAKRRIMTWHSQYNLDECGESHGREDRCPTLLALALPYADHPDYRQEWRP